MATSQVVGRTSSRTPFKHWVLNSELGRICGVLTTGKSHAKACPFHVVDLCAGDGHKPDANADTSPSIIERHVRWMRAHRLQAEATLIERSPQTFSVLRQNTPTEPWFQTLNIDARTFQLNATDRHQAIFIHADPNSIADWPVTPQLIDSMTETTTMLATLGCNVGGLKRLEVADRLEWFGHVQQCLEAMPTYHDAILIELENDASQWAYLLRLPARWSAETASKLLTLGSKYTSFNLNLASIRNQPIEFNSLQQKLFLTKKERGAK